jgi:hypothetical protein
MKGKTVFGGSFRQRKQRNLPKKILRHTKIKVNETYAFNASYWVADTPESNHYPTVNLTIQHNGDKVRLCFHDTAALINAIEELRHFVGDHCSTLHLSHSEAVEEYLSYHEKDRPPIIDYYTSTVIQEKPRKGRKRRAFVCNNKTGEILETITVEGVQNAGENISKQQSETGEINGEIQEG